MIAQTTTPALTLPHRIPQTLSRAPAPVAATDAGLRFTLDGSPELEAHLTRTCEKIAAGIRGLIPRRKLEGVLLGGGYGRGEGGVLKTAAGDRPYNDIEFYVFLRGNRHLNERRYGRALHVLGEILTPQAGAEVEFKIASLPEFARSATSMFSYDLALGHRWLIGREELLSDCGHHHDPEQIPLAEATRLLMNRCTGLLLAQERLMRREFTAADADFVRRNIAKAELALGDAVLVAHGCYHWSARERQRQLNRIAGLQPQPWLRKVWEHHAAGVDFKLHPERSAAPLETLRNQHAAIVPLARELWLWLEARRLNAIFLSPRDYANSRVEKWPDAQPWRNLLVNAKVLGPRALTEGDARRHPRERVLHALCLLLWEPATLTSPHLLHQVQRELRTTVTSFPDLVRAYRGLWEQLN